MPNLQTTLLLMPAWTVSLATFAIAVVLALAVNWVAFQVLGRLVANRDLFWRSLVSRSKGPTRLGLIMVALAIAAQFARLTPWQANTLSQIFLVVFILLLGWLAQTALHIFSTIYMRRFSLDSEDNLLARKHVTQIRILRRIADVLIIVTTISIALMTFDSVRQYGVSLLASAGAAGLIVGLALQPLFKNIFAGVQIAITQPIRIDDAVIVEGEWGNIEEIGATYVVVRIWDWRRLILPISYFIEQPFQNWTREGASLIGSVMFYLDYQAPVDAIRAKAKEIVEADRNWNKDVFAVQVTDFKERVMEVRVIASANSAGKAFDLRCNIREKLITFIQDEHPEALPRMRSEIDAIPEHVLQRAMKGSDSPDLKPSPPAASRPPRQ